MCDSGGMNALLLAVLPAASSLVGLLIWVAILAVVVWAVIALVRWAGIPIPQPVVILLTALASILLIVLLARALGFAV